MKKKEKEPLPEIEDGFTSKEEARERYDKANPPKPKKHKKYLISLPLANSFDFEVLMEKHGLRNRPSAMMCVLIANEANKKSVGRPPSTKPMTEEEADLEWIMNKPDFTNDLPKMYYNGAMRGPKEIAWEDEKDRRIKKHGTM